VALPPQSIVIADVHELGRLLSHHVHAEQQHVAAPEEQLQEPAVVADDPAARIVRVGGAPDDVVDAPRSDFSVAPTMLASGIV
jgi:hypothetical protein